MARPRTFEEEQAVEAAMRAFWESGYEATSTQDLCSATGLGRSSIYNAFASKRELFEKALRRYMEQRDAEMAELLESPLPIREKVRALLWGVVERAEGDPPGCMVVNALVELGPRDPELSALARRHQRERVAGLRDAFAAACAQGELAPDRDPEALAQFLMAAIGGMQVTVRGGGDRAALEAIAATTLRAF
ncbi:TetR/AcrR family transcriptional regulator [Nonomuraea sp. MCN248]|uniref:TetR/AcrR family transcriptional regulator n=1 Tax=Nonomuraea corallina TaxID=2989783 RepID=A0ABT4SGF9_9ACTN|nr:TetR/AcrR family transcriptional regulator [Nonomuraea corallina]MDA0636229.1 TetR/AcrR family transcriptional regulator [Nonomuraea corallina]